MSMYSSGSKFQAVLPEHIDSGYIHTGEAHWFTISRLQIGDVIGVGILAIGAGYALFGWALSIIFTIGFLPMTIYFSMLLWEARNEFPECKTMTQMAHEAVGRKWFTGFVAFSVYALLTLILGVYIGQLADALSGIFYESKICRYQWGMIALLLLLPFSQIQTLNGTRWLLFVNNICIVITVVMVVAYCINDMIHNGISQDTSVGPADITWQEVFAGLSTFVFAYNGSIIYLEFMSEMKNPADWPKTFLVSGPFQIALYGTVGVVGYLYKGSHAKDNGGNLADLIPNGGYSIAVHAFLFIYMYIAFLIKSTILTQVFCNLRQKYYGGESNGRKTWFAASLATLLLAYILGMMVPIFSLLISVAGSLFVPVTCIMYPIIFLWRARQRNGKVTGPVEKVILPLAFYGFGLFTILGTLANVWSIVESYSSNSPFACPA